MAQNAIFRPRLRLRQPFIWLLCVVTAIVLFRGWLANVADDPIGLAVVKTVIVIAAVGYTAVRIRDYVNSSGVFLAGPMLIVRDSEGVETEISIQSALAEIADVRSPRGEAVAERLDETAWPAQRHLVVRESTGEEPVVIRGVRREEMESVREHVNERLREARQSYNYPEPVAE